MRAISLADLLPARTAVRDMAPVRKAVAGKRVLITGAGGSIGSELTRQVMSMNPDHVTLFEQSEFNLYTIARRHPQAKAMLGDIRDARRINGVIKEVAPDIVFHAAALKHVPIVEQNPEEGYKTNVFGTRNVVDACTNYGVKKLVMISTDKAVDPECQMGITKKGAENLVRKNGFTVVRFGNVLGSSGSVVPLFEEQIKAGGPVTVTHPDVDRYFMSIEEAVELVLHALTLPPSLYVLDMGKPMRIDDLARDMIRLAGKMPDDEIKIKITGLRSGERMSEALVGVGEQSRATSIPGIFEVVENVGT